MLELLKSRRSIRRYEDKKVEKEKIDILLKAGLLAPSSRSRRPWEFIAVTEKDTLLKLSKCRKQSSQFLQGAPLGIVVVADSEACDVWVEDCSIAAILMQLTAHSIGLGSCWIQIRDRMYDENIKAEEYVKKVLNIPEKYSVECIIAAGYAGEEKKPYEDKDLKLEKLHFDKYQKEII